MGSSYALSPKEKRARDVDEAEVTDGWVGRPTMRHVRKWRL